MNKIGLIILREYISRVRKKSFIIMSILGPILFSSLFVIPIWLALREGDEKIVQIVDEGDRFGKQLKGNKELKYQMVNMSLDEAKEGLTDDIFGVLYIPDFAIDKPEGVKFYSAQNPGISIQKSMEREIEGLIEDIRLANSGLSQEMLDALYADVNVQTVNLSESGAESESHAESASAIGYVSAFMIYMFIFIYGAQVMRGVIEEKTSRIIEVMISSVRPFQLMMGKILGIASAGLTQFLIWVILSFGAIQGLGMVFASNTVDQAQVEAAIEETQNTGGRAQSAEMFANGLNALADVNMPLIIACFLFYFLCGYLFYGSLFAAVGSAVDSDADSQQFMLPITIPLILSIVMIGAVLKDPHGNLAFWMSILPFSSPVIMMMRLPFDVPTWQILLSMVSLIGGFCFTTWFAGRIYRIGIFMHGTKVNYKTLGKWFMMKI